MTKLKDNETMCRKIPYTGGIEYWIIAGSLTSSTIRCILETPFEYAKVRWQIGLNWQITKIFTGFVSNYPWNIGLMGTFFVTIDSVRWHTDIMKTKFGQFMASGSAALLAWWVIWPFDVIKSQIQAGTEGTGKTWMDHSRYMLKEYGVRGLYRGILPGSLSVFTRNGASFVMM